MVDTRTSGGTGPLGTIDEVLEGFARYARHERGLAPTTVENYLNQVSIPSCSGMRGKVIPRWTP